MKKKQSTLRSQKFTPLDKSSFTPLYFQIQTQLAQQIRSGKLHPGQGLPGEDELSRLFGVSRMTSRQALQGLKNEGLASRERGRGSFVLEPKVEKDITHLMGFTAEMRALGKQTSAQILEKATAAADPQVAEQLRIPLGAETFVLRRLRLADKKPFAIEEVTLSLDRFPGLEKLNFANRSLYETLRTKYAVRTGSADETIEARAATRVEAALMMIPIRSALLVISRTLLDAEGVPIEAARSLYRGDLYRAVFHLPATV